MTIKNKTPLRGINSRRGENFSILQLFGSLLDGEPAESFRIGCRVGYRGGYRLTIFTCVVFLKVKSVSNCPVIDPLPSLILHIGRIKVDFFKQEIVQYPCILFPA